MRRYLTLPLACTLALLTSCTAHTPRALAPAALPELTITAAVFENTTPANPHFTVQGLLEANGEPVTKVYEVEVTIFDEDARRAIDQHAPLTLDAVDGLFTIDVPLTRADVYADAGRLTVRITTTDTFPINIGSPIPLTYTPRAWAAEFAVAAQQAENADTADFATTAGSADTAAQASNADKADFATTAGFATNANAANTLADHAEIPLPLNPGWVDLDESLGDDTYTDPRAIRSGGFVRLTAVLSGDQHQTIIATLPQGWRPEKRHIFITASIITNEIARIDVSPSGNISFMSGANTLLSLDGIVFPVGP